MPQIWSEAARGLWPLCGRRQALAFSTTGRTPSVPKQHLLDTSTAGLPERRTEGQRHT